MKPISHFGKIIEQIRLSEFLRNALTLISGTSIAHLIPLLISPILSRLYTPVDFDVFAIYLSIVTLLSPIITGTYDQAIMLPKEDDDGFQIAVLATFLAFLVSLISIPVVIIWNRPLCLLFKNDEVGLWLYFVPLSIFLISLFNVQQSWYTRTKRFKSVALSQVVQSVGISLVNIGMGLGGWGAAGLVVGRVAGQVLSNMVLIGSGFRQRLRMSRHFFLKMWKNATLYRDFPFYTAPRVLLDGLRNTVLIFLITYLFAKGTLGSYSFMSKVLGTPLSLIGLAVAKVYYQKAADAHNRGKNIWFILRPVLIWLTLIALPILLILIFFGPELFAFIFGKEWTEAGKFARILSPWFLVSFIFTSVSHTPLIFNKQKTFFFLMGGFNIVIPLIFAFAAITSRDIEKSLWVLSITASIYMLILIFWYGYLVKKGKPSLPSSVLPPDSQSAQPEDYSPDGVRYG